jgi:hypothetical protein
MTLPDACMPVVHFSTTCLTSPLHLHALTQATTLGYYAGASGYLPPPPLLNTIMGREPRALPDAPQLSALGARRAPSSLVTEKDK